METVISSSKYPLILRILFVLLLLVVTQNSFAEQKLKQVSVELKWFHQFQFAGIYAAKEKGFYKDVGLDVTIVNRNPKSNPIKDVLSKKVDFGVSDSTIIRERLLGQPVVLLAAIFQHSPLVLITRNKQIISPLELRGKRVMYQKNVDDAIIMGMFNEFGMDENDFIHVPHTFQDDVLLNKSLKIDAMSAYLSNQPYYYQQKGVELNLIKPQNYGVDFYGDIIFTSEEYYKSNKDVALAFRKATIAGWRYAVKHPDEIIDLILKKYKTGKDRKALEYEAEVVKRMIVEDHIEVGYVSKERLRNIAQHYQRADPLIQHKKIDGLYYEDYQQTPVQYRIILYIILALVAALGVTVIIMWVFNQRLKRRITERTQAIAEANKKLAQNYSINDRYIAQVTINIQGKILDVSSAFEYVSGINKNEFINSNLFESNSFDFLSEENKILFKTNIQKGINFSTEIAIYNKQNKIIYFATTVNCDKTTDNLITLIMMDITDKKNIEHISVTDNLTKIGNRYKLNSQLELEIERVKRYHEPLSILMIDLDYFKNVNDKYGHNVGDKILCQTTRVMQKAIRKSDFIGRWGGEEFLIICPHTDYKQAEILANHIVTSVAENKFSENVTMTVSIGVAQWNEKQGIEELIANADKALYRAKSAGRNCVGENEREA